tara:strand:+ start:1954 stop:4512 length:2559 start_codon:yes stop_codon:yes gene_type:complete
MALQYKNLQGRNPYQGLANTMESVSSRVGGSWMSYGDAVRKRKGELEQMKAQKSKSMVDAIVKLVPAAVGYEQKKEAIAYGKEQDTLDREFQQSKFESEKSDRASILKETIRGRKVSEKLAEDTRKYQSTRATAQDNQWNRMFKLGEDKAKIDADWRLKQGTWRQADEIRQNNLQTLNIQHKNKVIELQEKKLDRSALEQAKDSAYIMDLENKSKQGLQDRLSRAFSHFYGASYGTYGQDGYIEENPDAPGWNNEKKGSDGEVVGGPGISEDEYFKKLGYAGGKLDKAFTPSTTKEVFMRYATADAINHANKNPGWFDEHKVEPSEEDQHSAQIYDDILSKRTIAGFDSTLSDEDLDFEVEKTGSVLATAAKKAPTKTARKKLSRVGDQEVGTNVDNTRTQASIRGGSADMSVLGSGTVGVANASGIQTIRTPDFKVEPGMSASKIAVKAGEQGFEFKKTGSRSLRPSQKAQQFIKSLNSWIDKQSDEWKQAWLERGEGHKLKYNENGTDLHHTLPDFFSQGSGKVPSALAQGTDNVSEEESEDLIFPKEDVQKDNATKQAELEPIETPDNRSPVPIEEASKTAIDIAAELAAPVEPAPVEPAPKPLGSESALEKFRRYQSASVPKPEPEPEPQQMSDEDREEFSKPSEFEVFKGQNKLWYGKGGLDDVSVERGFKRPGMIKAMGKGSSDALIWEDPGTGLGPLTIKRIKIFDKKVGDLVWESIENFQKRALKEFKYITSDKVQSALANGTEGVILGDGGNSPTAIESQRSEIKIRDILGYAPHETTIKVDYKLVKKNNKVVGLRAIEKKSGLEYKLKLGDYYDRGKLRTYKARARQGLYADIRNMYIKGMH